MGMHDWAMMLRIVNKVADYPSLRDIDLAMCKTFGKLFNNVYVLFLP